MSFLAPLWLALIGAAAVPILIHLWRRRIAARVEFPAARYIARAEQENSRRLRLRNLLIMLARVLAVLCVALAAARPVGRFVGGTHAPTALAIVLDNSLSTGAVVGGRPVLDALKAAARGALDGATAADRVWLVTADAGVIGGPVSALRDALDRVEPLGGAGNLAAAVSRAAGLVGGAGLSERRIAVATDGQATAWPEPVAVGDVDITVLQPDGAPPPNRAVLAAAAVPPRWTPAGAVTARLLTPDSVTFRVSLGERTLARGTTGPDGAVLVRASPPERGWMAGAVELEPDELRGDDVRHFALWIGAPPRVAVDPSAGPFAGTALDALRDARRIELAAGAGTEVVSAAALRRLPALIVAPSDPTRLGAANRALERVGVPWRLGAADRSDRPVRGDRLADVTVGVRWRLERRGTAPADTLARVGEEPWIVAGDGYVLIASPLDPAATSLPVRAAFVPWLAEVLTQRLSGEQGSVRVAPPGARLVRPSWADGLEHPDGTRAPLPDATFAAPARAGTYFLRRGDERRGAVVVAAEDRESVLRRLPARDLRARLRGGDVEVLARPDRWAAALFAGSARRPLVGAFLLAALALLAVEALLAGGSRPRPA
ncbi:MAG TPA: BatA and WFA domain-containing protein [Gemmatimonadaceae bacterium]|nr:BatA and WFA domain-containing protein [Gemmatimonadaceae bacterium]